MSEILKYSLPEAMLLPLNQGGVPERGDEVAITSPTESVIGSDCVGETTNYSSHRERIYRSYIGRMLMGGISAFGLAGGSVALEASPAHADNPVYTAVNPDDDGTYSIYDRNSPRWADSDRKVPDYSLYGDKLELLCGTNGEAVGPYDNKRWHYAKNLSRPEAGVTWIPDRYLNTPNDANQPTPGERECGTAEPVSSVSACYFNLKAPSKNLTFSYSGEHRYYGNAWQAAKNWTDTGVGITINPGSSSTAYIQFKDVSVKQSWAATTKIPITPEWLGPHRSVPSKPHLPNALTILVNRRIMDGLNDFQRTYTLTHEVGHTLGLAHPDHFCQDTGTSIMSKGTEEFLERTFNTPTAYDRMELEQLYR